MIALEIINSKLEELKNNTHQISPVNIDELSTLKNELLILDETQKALDDDKIMINYNFDSSIQLLSKYTIKIES